MYAGKKTPGGAGTHTGHTGHTGTDGHTDHTDEPDNHPNPTTHPHDHATAETAAKSTAARTAAGPEPTAPRGRLRRSRPQQTRPGRLPLPERLPAPPPLDKAVGEMKAREAAASVYRY